MHLDIEENKSYRFSRVRDWILRILYSNFENYWTKITLIMRNIAKDFEQNCSNENVAANLNNIKFHK